MRLPRRQFLHLAAGTAALPAVSRMARAQAYPARPVRVIVPYAPGGPTDVCARLIAQGLSGPALGRQFYVENIAGAGGNIGTGQAARAAADGYSILVTVNSHVINPTLYSKDSYDPVQGFRKPSRWRPPSASALSVNPSVPARTVQELVTLIKAGPGKYSFASPGFGSPSHLHWASSSGSWPASTSCTFALRRERPGNRVDGRGSHTHRLRGAVGSGAAGQGRQASRALAVMSKSRSQALPDLPTIAEAGYPGLEGDGWVGVLVPAEHATGDHRGTPARDRPDRCAARGQGGCRHSAFSRPGRRYARGVHGANEARDGEVGQGDPRGQPQGRVNPTSWLNIPQSPGYAPLRSSHRESPPVGLRRLLVGRATAVLP